MQSPCANAGGGRDAERAAVSGVHKLTCTKMGRKDTELAASTLRPTWPWQRTAPGSSPSNGELDR